MNIRIVANKAGIIAKGHSQSLPAFLSIGFMNHPRFCKVVSNFKGTINLGVSKPNM